MQAYANHNARETRQNSTDSSESYASATKEKSKRKVQMKAARKMYMVDYGKIIEGQTFWAKQS